MSDGDKVLEHTTRRAPHMERFVSIRPYATDGYPDGWRVDIAIGNQGFSLSDGNGPVFESKFSAEWTRDMLCIALGNLVKIAMDDPSLMREIAKSDFLRASIQSQDEDRSADA